MSDHIIIAPHPDDEIIGTYEILKSNRCLIIYTAEVSNNRMEIARGLQKHVDIKGQFFLKNIPPTLLDKSKSNTFYFPHPMHETHPLHREYGMMGELLARDGYDVIFYSTEMNAPFKFECKEPETKKLLLNTVYEDQKSLWEYDHKYFLFSGYDKWIFLNK